MITIPAIALCGMLAMLAATILSKPWHKYVALGCAVVETCMVIFLVVVPVSYK